MSDKPNFGAQLLAEMDDHGFKAVVLLGVAMREAQKARFTKGRAGDTLIAIKTLEARFDKAAAAALTPTAPQPARRTLMPMKLADLQEVMILEQRRAATLYEIDQLTKATSVDIYVKETADEPMSTRLKVPAGSPALAGLIAELKQNREAALKEIDARMLELGVTP